MLMKKYLDPINTLKVATLGLLASVIVLSDYQPVAAILVNNDYVEKGITQFDQRVSGDTSCSDEPQTTGGGIVGGINLGSEPKERRINLIKAFMATYQLTAEQAAGMVGNFAHEAGFYDPADSPGGSVRPDVNQGDSAGRPPNSSELGYGWAQWSGGRKTSFVRFMNEHPQWVNEGRATDTADFYYLKKELDGTYQSTITELKRQSTPRDATISFERTFERAGDPQMDKRIRWAETAFREYRASGSGTDPGTNTPTPCATSDGVGTGQSAKFGEVAFPLKGSKKVVLNPGMFHDGTADQGGHPYIAYDILARGGTEVVAFADGEVTYESVDRCGGKFLTIWNEEAQLGVTYMHLSSHISKGEKVRTGEHVGVVGDAAAGCGTEHLHIDVAIDKVRQACSRLGCSILDHFRSIGPDLYETFQALPDN